jgi:hypothetical protein
MKTRLILLFIIQLTICHHLLAQVNKDNNVNNSENDNYINLDIGAQLRDGMITGRIESSYNWKIHEKGFLGGKVGLQQSGIFRTKIHFGPSYSYFIFDKSSTPFISLDLRLDLINEKYKTFVDPNETKTDLGNYIGGTGLIFLGYKFKKPNKNISYECKFGIGPSIVKETIINYNYYGEPAPTYGDYIIELNNFLMVGLNF